MRLKVSSKSVQPGESQAPRCVDGRKITLCLRAETTGGCFEKVCHKTFEIRPANAIVYLKKQLFSHRS